MLHSALELPFRYKFVNPVVRPLYSAVSQLYQTESVHCVRDGNSGSDFSILASAEKQYIKNVMNP